MKESLAGMIKEIAGAPDRLIVTGSVIRSSPLQLQLDEDTSIILTKDNLIVPAHVSLAKGNTAYLLKNENKYFVLGKR